MDFDEAEIRFRELQQRRQSGERINPATYAEQLRQLAVYHAGLWWEIDPQTGRWTYFDGARWIEGVPPDRTATTGALAGSPSRNEPALSVQPSVRVGARLRSGDKPLPTLPPPREKHVSLGYARRARQNERRPRVAPWVIGVSTLTICIIVFLGGRFLVTGFLPSATPSGVRLALPTRTPEPTLIRVPTPALTPTPLPVSAIVIEARVNVRWGPSLNDKIVDRVQKGDRLTVIGRNADSTWYRVIMADKTEPGWVFGETVEITSGDPAGLPSID